MPQDPQPATTAIVPNVIGKGYDVAKTELTAARFEPVLSGTSAGTVRTEKDPDGKDAAGERLDIGTSITLTMSGLAPM